ncbi:MAG: hypothetical protein CL910_18640 [Deltaproteobacteria bacterium]|jgi:fumarate reductase subunit C|nr:hypothetical protein [Deltaproteobacteria bacterium]
MSTSTPRVDSMKPATPGPTRTAPPRPPDKFPSAGRYPAYLAFGACGAFLMISALVLIGAVWAVGNGEAAWNDYRELLSHPVFLVYHVAAFIGLTWFTLRLFRLFPATQPYRIGPLKRPADAVMVAGLYGLFFTVLAVGTLFLGGALL